MNKFIKYIIILYFTIVLLSQIYYFDIDRLNYLKGQSNIFGVISHLLFPIVKYKLPNDRGFYTLIFNFIVFEIFVKEEFRGKGFGKELMNDLIQKHSIYILNDRTKKTSEKLFKNKNFKVKHIPTFNNSFITFKY
jgi:GNAT superfamily N-acetyltransferase